MKANSERVVGKNFRHFNGKSLFSWILDTLLAVEEIDQIIINTDARAILANNGLMDTNRITIRDRKPEICGDFVSMNLVLADDVANVHADIYLMTHTTNPLLSVSSVKGSLDLYRKGVAESKCDSVFTVNKFQTRFYRADVSAINHDPDNLIRTQDLEPWFEENSNLYVFSQASFASTNARIGNKPLMFEMGRTESVDIDDQESWHMAEAMSMYLLNKPN
ncbi:MAG: acylneuraminate cytidylyltransferase family protein [Cytophaga sp.]|nr:acylneuraminate cytidylyltransferase family protein [Undibacterium sp.]